MAGRHIRVIGAGVVGLCTADALLDHGFRVSVFERDASPGHGCSYGNGGIVVPSHFVPLAAPGMIMTGLKMMPNRRSPFGIEGLFNLEMLGWIAQFMRASSAAHVERAAPVLRDLNLASRDAYELLVGELGVDVGYARRGLLMLCRTPAALSAEAHLAENANALGLGAEVLDQAGVAQLEPNVDMDVSGGVYFQDDAHLSPPAFMQALRERVLRRGGEIHDGQDVKDLRVNQGVVSSDSGDDADEYVLATGAWTGEIARKLGFRLPMLAGKGYGLTVHQPPQTPRLPSILVEGRIAVTPMTDGVRFVGTMELGRVSESTNLNRVEGIRDSIPHYYPKFSRPLLERSDVWTGLRPCSPDGMPYIGRPNGFKNLIVAAGHAMMGMSLGPITGKLVAQIASGDPTSIPLNLLSPNRYA